MVYVDRWMDMPAEQQLIIFVSMKYPSFPTSFDHVVGVGGDKEGTRKPA